MGQINTLAAGDRIRINYWDGDVLDVATPPTRLHSEAKQASLNLRADVDAVTNDNTVLATYRDSKQLD